MPILGHPAHHEHDRAADARTVVFVVSKVGPVPAPTVSAIVADVLTRFRIDQAGALVFNLTAAMPCPVCGCGPATCESTGCGHMCCCPDSYPLPAAALVDEQRAQEPWFAGLLAADDANLNQDLGRLVVADSRGADDWGSFAECFPGPVVFCVDELAELRDAVEARRDAALAQRTELHLDLPDDLLADLALSAGGAR